MFSVVMEQGGGKGFLFIEGSQGRSLTNDMNRAVETRRCFTLWSRACCGVRGSEGVSWLSGSWSPQALLSWYII